VRYDNVVPQDTETSPLALHNGLVSVSWGMTVDWSECLALFPGSFPKRKESLASLGGGGEPWTFGDWNLCLKVSNSL